MQEIVKLKHTDYWLKQSLSYGQYRQLSEDLFAQGKTTGLNQSSENLEATKMNLQRMQRLDKTAQLNDALQSRLSELKKDLIFLTITEAWCGDAAQNLPWIHQIALASHGRITDRYILRDDNPDLMDQFLTGGSRSIPKLIVLDGHSHEILTTWGPRPQAIQDWFLPIRKSVKEEEKKTVYTQLHKRYADDKGQEFQKDLLNIIAELIP
jgi:hypothetical protein